MIKFSSWVDCDSYCSSINFFQKHRNEAEAQAFLSFAKAHLFTSFPFTNIRYLSHRMPLVKVSRCLLTEKKNFHSSHSISCPLFCVVLFILKTNSPFTIFYSPFILFHSQLSWKREFPCLMFEEPEKNRFVFIKNELYYVMCIFAVGAWMDQVHHTTASF